MGRSVGINDLSKELSGILNEYSEFVTQESKKAIKKVGSEAAKELQAKSPKKSGDYAKSWKSKVASETSTTIHVSVYAGNHQYSLTHLLEDGHDVKNSKTGPVIGHAPAIKHIKPVSDTVDERVTEVIKRQL